MRAARIVPSGSCSRRRRWFHSCPPYSSLGSSPMPSPRNKVVLVTGGGRGLGRAIVEQLAADGADVAFGYRSNAEAAGTLAERADEWGVALEAIAADLATADGPPALVARAVERFGRIDAVVVNAAVWKRAP